MKKFKYAPLFIFFVSILCLFSFFIFPTNNSESNISSAWTEYLLADDKSVYGDLIPEKYEATATASPLASTSTLPSYYCLRDDCIIYTTDQSNFGLCWAYTMNTALSTSLQLQYNEYYDFSSAWTSITTKKFNTEKDNYSSYVVGSGGNHLYFQNALEEYGAMLSTDFDLTDLYSVDNNNYNTFYNLYKDYTFDLSEYSPTIVTYTSNGTTDFNKTIKKHIKNYGSLYASIKSDDIKNETCLYSTIGGTTDHAISIIGWDDEYTAPSWKKDNVQIKGAWIALNSWGDDWGNNGIFYISYKDVCANKAMYGIKVKSKDDISQSQKTISIASSSSDFKNKITNAYGSSPQKSTSSLKEKINNVFYSNEKIEIEYGYNFSETPEITIESNNKKVNILFNKISTTSTITLIEGDNIESGTYKVTFNFKSNNTKLQKVFIVLDGNEVYEVLLYSDCSDNDTTLKYPNHFGNFNSYNKKQIIYDVYADSHVALYLYSSTYSNITNHTYTSSSGLSVSISNGLTIASEQNFSKGRLVCNLNLRQNSSLEKFTITLISNLGKSTTYTINIYAISYYGNNLKYVYTNVDYDGGSHVIAKEVIVTDNSLRKIYLSTPTKGSSTFNGWYYSNDGKNYNTKLPSDSNGYYITNSMILKNKSKNYATQLLKEKYEYDDTFYYIFLQAKWTANSYTITYEYEDSDGNIQTEFFSITSNFDVVNFEAFTSSIPEKAGFEYVWSSPFSEVDTKNKVIKNLNQDIKIYGKYILLAPELKACKINNAETLTLSKTYDGIDVLLKANAEHNGENVELKYVWKKQNIFGIYIKISESNTSELKLNSAKDSGIYLCEITASILGKNESSKVTTSPFNIKIDKAKTTINTDLIEKEFTYDGKTHVIDGASINHNETDVKYSNNILKNVGFNSVTIYTQETDNYLPASEIIEVKINKAKVTIKIENKRSAIFSQKQNFTYEVKFGTVFEGDDLQLKYQSNATTLLAGTYDINAISLNDNYDVEVIGGTYTVYLEGLGLVLIIFFMVVLTALLCLLIYFVIKRKSNIKHLNSKDFDDDIRFKD